MTCAYGSNMQQKEPEVLVKSIHCDRIKVTTWDDQQDRSIDGNVTVNFTIKLNRMCFEGEYVFLPSEPKMTADGYAEFIKKEFLKEIAAWNRSAGEGMG